MVGDRHHWERVTLTPIVKLRGILLADTTVAMTGFKTMPLRRRKEVRVQLTGSKETHKLLATRSTKHVQQPAHRHCGVRARAKLRYEALASSAEAKEGGTPVRASRNRYRVSTVSRLSTAQVSQVRMRLVRVCAHQILQV